MRMHNPPHPGEVLKEFYLVPLILSITKVAEGIDVTRKALSELINGHTGVSPEMALKLAEAFDTTAEYWLALQQEYNLFKARNKIDLSSIKHFFFVKGNNALEH